MSLTAPYISAKLAVYRLSGIGTVLDYIGQMSADLKDAGLPKDKIDAMMSFYKQRVLDFIELQVTDASTLAIIHSLSSAGESDNKNTLLTPIIAGIVVNPAAASNTLELTEMLADGLEVAQELTQILTNATNILS